jgi:hypothetical protein
MTAALESTSVTRPRFFQYVATSALATAAPAFINLEDLASKGQLNL